MDLFSAMAHVEDRKEALWTAWTDNSRQDFERVLRLTIQEVESVKERWPELNCSVQYQLGKLDGVTVLFEQFYRAAERMKAIKKNLARQTPKSRQILMYLYKNKDVNHGELAEAIGSSYSSLTNIMKKVLLSGAVESARSGKYTYYNLTEAGRKFCECQTSEKNELLESIRTAVRECISATIPKSLPASISVPSQSLNLGERFIPVFNDDEIGEAMTFDSLIRMGDLKYAKFSKVNDEKHELQTAGQSVR